MNCGNSRSAIAGLLVLVSAAVFLGGCGQAKEGPGPQTAKDPARQGADAEQDHAAAAAKIEAARAKLSAEDRELVAAQEFCVVQTKQRLGSMGTPIKLEIQGQPVFLCCKSCTRKANAEPEKTLKTLEELKAKVKAKAPGG